MAGNEWTYLKTCLDTNFVSSVGPFVDQFESSVAAYVGAKFGVATSSGTGALHVALMVGGIQRDEEVLVSSLTFIAPANAIRYVGAWPVFIDADEQYWQMDPQKVRDFLERECHWRDGQLRNSSTGRIVRAILPVDVLGHPCDLDPLIELARRYDLRIIEDASEALGARYRGRNVGTAADISCLSFNGNKIITTGGGGMVITNNAQWAQRARYLTTQAKDHPIEHIHGEVGYNYRLTNLQAAVGCAQLERLEEYVEIKRRLAVGYADGMGPLSGVRSLAEPSWARSSFWMSAIRVDPAVFGMTSRDLMRFCQEKGIETRPLWEPLHLARPHRDCQAYHCDVAENLYREALCLPSSIGLSADDQRRVITTVAAAVRR